MDIEKLTAEELSALLGRDVEDMATRDFRDRLRSVADEVAVLKGRKVFRLVAPGRRSVLLVSVEDMIRLAALERGRSGDSDDEGQGTV